VHGKTWAELGPRFWVPWCTALLALSVGLAVWVYRSVDGAANWYALSSLAYSYWMVVLAGTSSRLLTQEALSFQWLHWGTHAAAYLYLMGLCMLLWRFPVALDGRWMNRPRLLTVLVVWCTGFMLVDVMEWVDSISLGFRLPNLAPALLLLGLYTAQWRRSRAQPLQRAQLKWLGLLLVLTLTVPFVASVYAIVDMYSPMPMAYGMVVIQSRLLEMNRSIEEAAMDLGARPMQVFFLITLPNIFQAILAAFLLAFTLSFDDVVISEFLSGPGVNTLPQVIFGYARRGINPTIYAAATLLIVTVTVVIVAYAVWVARATRRREREIAAATRAELVALSTN